MFQHECLCSDTILSRPFVNKHLHPSHNSPPSRSQTPDFKDSEFIYSCLSSGLLELLMARHRFALSSGVCSARCMCCPQERLAHVPPLRRVSLTAVRSAHVPELPSVSLAAETLKTQRKHAREVSCFSEVSPEKIRQICAQFEKV